jgi:uncharacterized LabA/DUF88 family protein
VNEGSATFLQVDLQNMYAYASHNQKIDLEKIWHHINDRETEMLIGSIVYTIRSPEIDSVKFEAKLKTIGFDIRTKLLTRIKKPKEMALINLDVLITMECLIRRDFFDKWILISNNGTFSDLCKYLREIGKKVEIWCFRDIYDPSLELYADKLHFIDDEFCLKRQSISVFGINWGLEKLDRFDSTTFWGNM